MKTFAKIIAGLVLTPTLMILNSIFGGIVLSIIWGWFIIPVFHTVSMNYLQAIGVSFVVSFFFKGFKMDKSAEETFKSYSFFPKIILMTIANAGAYAIMLGLAAMFHYWVIC